MRQQKNQKKNRERTGISQEMYIEPKVLEDSIESLSISRSTISSTPSSPSSKNERIGSTEHRWNICTKSNSHRGSMRRVSECTWDTETEEKYSESYEDPEKWSGSLRRRSPRRSRRSQSTSNCNRGETSNLYKTCTRTGSGARSRKFSDCSVCPCSSILDPTIYPYSTTQLDDPTTYPTTPTTYPTTQPVQQRNSKENIPRTRSVKINLSSKRVKKEESSIKKEVPMKRERRSVDYGNISLKPINSYPERKGSMGKPPKPILNRYSEGKKRKLSLDYGRKIDTKIDTNHSKNAEIDTGIKYIQMGELIEEREKGKDPQIHHRTTYIQRGTQVEYAGLKTNTGINATMNYREHSTQIEEGELKEDVEEVKELIEGSSIGIQVCLEKITYEMEITSGIKYSHPETLATKGDFMELETKSSADLYNEYPKGNIQEKAQIDQSSITLENFQQFASQLEGGTDEFIQIIFEHLKRHRILPGVNILLAKELEEEKSSAYFTPPSSPESREEEKRENSRDKEDQKSLHSHIPEIIIIKEEAEVVDRKPSEEPQGAENPQYSVEQKLIDISLNSEEIENSLEVNKIFGENMLNPILLGSNNSRYIQLIHSPSVGDIQKLIDCPTPIRENEDYYNSLMEPRSPLKEKGDIQALENFTETPIRKLPQSNMSNFIMDTPKQEELDTQNNIPDCDYNESPIKSEASSQQINLSSIKTIFKPTTRVNADSGMKMEGALFCKLQSKGECEQMIERRTGIYNRMLNYMHSEEELEKLNFREKEIAPKYYYRAINSTRGRSASQMVTNTRNVENIVREHRSNSLFERERRSSAY